MRLKAMIFLWEEEVDENNKKSNCLYIGKKSYHDQF